MLGRTNISGGGGANINGDIITATVSGDKTINEGDFVTFTKIKKTIQSSLFPSKKAHYNKSLFVGILGTNLKMYDLNNDNFVVVDTFLASPIKDFCIIDGKIACVSNSSNTLQVFLLDFNNGQFNIVSSSNAVYTDHIHRSMAIMGEHSFIIASSRKDLDANIDFYFFAIENESLVHKKTKRITSGLLGFKFSSFWTLHIYENCITIINAKFDTHLFFELNTDEFDVINNNKSTSSISGDSYEILSNDGNKILISKQTGAGSERIGVLDVINKQHITANIITNSSYSIYRVIGTTKKNIVLVLINEKFDNTTVKLQFKLARFFPETNTLAVISTGNFLNEKIGNIYQTGAMLFDNNLYAYIHAVGCSTKLFIKKTNIQMTEVDDTTDKNLVLSYSGETAIGIAKDSGEVGEEIQVYVPAT